MGHYQSGRVGFFRYRLFLGFRVFASYLPQMLGSDVHVRIPIGRFVKDLLFDGLCASQRRIVAGVVRVLLQLIQEERQVFLASFKGDLVRTGMCIDQRLHGRFGSRLIDLRVNFRLMGDAATIAGRFCTSSIDRCRVG